MKILLSAALMAAFPTVKNVFTVPPRSVEIAPWQREEIQEPAPFSKETVEELAAYRAILETSFGPITLELFADKAPNHVRNFLRLASLGAYDGTSFHRILPGFMIQTGLLSTRSEPPPDNVMRYVNKLEPEPNDTAHVKGTVSMALEDDLAAGSTSFLICTAESSSLDGKYTAFGRVLEGLRVVEALQAVPTDGDKPLARVNLIRVRLEKAPH